MRNTTPPARAPLLFLIGCYRIQMYSVPSSLKTVIAAAKTRANLAHYFDHWGFGLERNLGRLILRLMMNVPAFVVAAPARWDIDNARALAKLVGRIDFDTCNRFASVTANYNGRCEADVMWCALRSLHRQLIAQGGTDAGT